MKLKFSKRVLSAFLALLMVVTTLPTFAINAFADTNSTGLVGAYLSNDVTTGIAENHGNVTWDENEKAAYFSGNDSYLVLDGAPMKSVTASSGFAVSFDIKRDTSNGTMARVFDFNDGTTSRTFALNSGSNDNYERYITLARPNGTEVRYYANDFANTNYCDPAGSAWLGEEKPGVWYNITISMDSTGAYSYYIDGELAATFKPDYYSVFGSTVTPTDILNGFVNYNKYLIGTSIFYTTGSATSDGCFHGYIKNLKLYDTAANAVQAFAGDVSSDLATLKAAMAEYESRMNGTVYTNMGAAYDAYVAANKAYDAYYYGGNTSADIVTAAANLAKATMKMNAYIPYTANATSAADGSYTSSSLVNGDEMSNVLYTYGVGGNSSYKTGATASGITARITAGVQFGAIVFLYDGVNTMACPINGMQYRSYGVSTVRARYIAITSSDACELLHYWHGPGSSATYVTDTSESALGYAEGDTEHAFAQQTSNHYYSNTLYMNKSTVASNFANGYYSATPTFKIEDNNSRSTSVTNATVYAIDYASLILAVKGKTDLLASVNVSDYKEGGLSNALSVFDSATALDPNSYFSNSTSLDVASAVSQCAGAISSAVSNLNSLSSMGTADNGSYQAIRDAFDYSGTIPAFVESGDETVYSVRDAYNNGVRKGFSASSYNAFSSVYTNNQMLMANVIGSNGYNNNQVLNNGNTFAQNLINAFNALEPVAVSAPSVTADCILGPDDVITITNNADGSTVTYSVTYNNGTAGASGTFTDASLELAPFDGATEYTSATVTAHSTLDGDDSREVTATYTFLKAPTLSVKDGDALNEKSIATVTSTNTTPATLEYSWDGETWFDYTAAVTPFADYQGTSRILYAREVNGNATSAVVSATLIRSATFGIYSSTGTKFVDKDSTIYIGDVTPYGDEDIIYVLSLNGATGTTEYVYDKENGIVIADHTELLGAKIIEITAYAESQKGTAQTVTAKFFNSDNYDPLAYQESFDGTTISGTTLTTGNTDKGRNGVLNNADSASVVAGAGTIDSNGNSSDWRENVLKINANATTPGNKITLTSNPLSSPANADIAKSTGVTLSFWRHIEDTSGNTINVPGDGWLCGLTFNGATGHDYFIVSDVAYTSYHATDSYDNYLDAKPDFQDPTQHAAGNNSGYWVHIAVTIDPNNGVTIYTNGEPHPTQIQTGGKYTENNAALAQDILTFLTDENTTFELNSGISQGNDCVVYLDDIRLYSNVLTQLDINNMYTDEYADIDTATLTAHDPTAVTVYTLTNGKVVGREYLDKNNLDPSEIAKVEYYMFGTGMTVYHSDDNVNWEVVGDSQGRTGYQNEELFGDVYTTALAEPLAYAAQDTVHPGAGYLVWAPHVMYNLTLEKWCYYGSTSSWGSQTSAIFLCTSDSPTGPYKYDSIVYRSAGHPNAIDPCVYYDKDYTALYMVYGSWGGDNAIYVRTLGADGRDLNNGPGTLICRGIDGALETVAGGDSGSGEGAYVYYDRLSGYYYLYVSYGQNSGSYVERVYRSESPNSGFVGYNGISATDSTTQGTHGNQILSSFSLDLYNYMYTSTGHNSVYPVVNSDDDVVTVNAVHARPYANEDHNFVALEDGALITRQSDLAGNVTLRNLIAYTEEGWPVMLPLQYNGTDSPYRGITAYDLQGIYSTNSMQLSELYNWTEDSTTYIVATSEDEAIIYGVTASGIGFTSKAVLSVGEDHTNYITIYDEAQGMVNKGVVATQIDENGELLVEYAFIKSTNGEHSWAYKRANFPDPDITSAGDVVTMDDIIYTHENNGYFAKYGQEISDDFSYGTSAQNLGERYTSISVRYPYYIDTTTKGGVYCLSDEERCKTGEYTGGDYDVVEQYNGLWVDVNGNTYTDAQAAALQAANPSQFSMFNLHKVYTITGHVSNYFKYDETTGAYTESGVELIISYTDGTNTYGEYEFCYVMPNPAMAHSIVAVRNSYKGLYDGRLGTVIYSRFRGSEGRATNIMSDITYMGNISKAVNDTPVNGTGTYSFLGYFGNAESVAYDYTKPANITAAFNLFTAAEGVNSGSYGLLEHESDNDRAHTMTSAVVDVDYYIDYSNTNESLITRDANGTPTGYSLDFLVSNIEWFNKADPGAATSYMRNSTGLTATATLLTNSAYYSSSSSYLDSSYPDNRDVLGYGDPTLGRKVMSGYYLDPANYTDTTYKTGLTQVFDLIDNGGNGDDGGGASRTNDWTGQITLTGRDSVAKNVATADSIAETYANFIYEKGTYKYQSILGGYKGGEEAYAYYNLGVSTCDKGAVRYFVENFLNQDFDIEYNEDGTIKSLEPVGEIYSDLYSVSSYREYLNAVAEAYWFIENTHNTTYEGGTKEFTTAYAEDGTPIFDTSVVGTNIFGDATTYTDPVQAEVIQNVIEAYENLVDRDTYENSAFRFEQAKTDLLTAIQSGDYTADSINNFYNILDMAAPYFVYKTNFYPGDADVNLSWRYTELNVEDFNDLVALIEAFESALMPKADTTALEAAIADKEPVVDNGIYTDSVQTFSLGSWLDLDSELAAANDILEPTKEENTPMYVADEAQTASFLDDSYEYQTAPAIGDTEAQLSDEQIEINDEADTLNAMALVPVDEPDTYVTFDNVVTIVTTLDRDKYTDEGLAKLDDLVAQLNEGAASTDNIDESLVGRHVYSSVDDVERYNEVTGAGLTTDTKLKMTGTGETDALSAALLELVNTLNEDYVKMFTATIDVQDENRNPIGERIVLTQPYGTMFEPDISSVAGDATVVNWSATLYEGTSADYVDGSFTTNATLSKKIAGVDGTVLQRKADSNVMLTATVVDESAATAILVKILDVYSGLIDVAYVNDASEVVVSDGGKTLTIGGNAVEAESIPFYNFGYWKITEADGVITADPIYTATENYTIEVADGELSGNTVTETGDSTYNVIYDKLVTLSTDVENFVAWAVETAEGTYQIASYNADYSFYSCADEKYIPISAIDNGDKLVYYIGDSSEGNLFDVTKIENALPENEIADIDAADFIEQKLAAKAPFVAIQNIAMVENNTKARVYVRVTEGSNDQLKAYGVYYKQGNVDATGTEYKRPVDKLLPSGQFLVTLIKTSGFTTDVSYKAYVNYDFTYSFTSSTTDTSASATINAIDMTEYKAAELA